MEESAPNRTTLGTHAARLWVLIACAVPIATIIYTAIAYAPIQFNDQWDEIFWLQRFYAGHASLSDLWRPEPYEHCILFPRLFIIVDLLLFHATNAFLTPTSVTIQAGTCALFIWVAWRLSDLPTPERLFLTGCYLIAIMAATQIENFTWGYQVQFVMVYCTAIAAIVALAQAARVPVDRRARLRWVVGGGLCATVSTFSMSNGILVWPILVLLGILSRLRRREFGALLGIGAVTVLLRLAVGFTRANPAVLWANPAKTVQYYAWYLGSPFRHSSLAAVQGFGIAAVVLSVLLPLLYLVRIRRATPFATVHTAILGFIILSGVATCIGRLDWPLDLLINSRYTTPALIFWASALSLLLYGAWHAPWGIAPPATGVMTVLVVAALALFLVPAHRVAGRAAAGYSRASEFSSIALVVGVEDPEALAELHLFPEKLPPVIPFLREKRLSVFATNWAATMNQPLAARYDVLPVTAPSPEAPPRCIGRMERLTELAVGGPDPAVRRRGTVEGWAWDAEASRPVDFIAIVDARGIVRGLALPGVPREDVQANVGPHVHGTVDKAGWFGYVAVPDAGPLIAYAIPQGETVAYPLMTGGTP